ncbi:MAG: alkaline shock response membrane anchor protein AmaP [Actinomycetota bacterium]|nr:alkaline shock response membrane anchor protein AmaP [Actinomycetota bacterium]
MNIFNKIIVILILVFLVGLSAVFMVDVFIGYFSWSDIASKIINPEYSVNKVIGFLASLAVFAIGVFLLLMEFYRRKPKVANISSSDEGNAMVTLDTISRKVRNEVLKIDGLDEVKVKIVPKAAGIIINMNARLKENIDIPEKMQEIIEKTGSMVSGRLGIKVIKTNLTIVKLIPGGKEKAEKKEEVAGSGEIDKDIELSEEEEISVEERDND